MLMRSALADGRTAPVVNTATNPSFERVVAGSTVVRRNLWSNPLPASTRGFGTPSPTVFPSVVFDAGWAKWVAPAEATATANSMLCGSGNTDLVPVVPGATYTVSFEMRASVAGTYRPAVNFRDSAAAHLVNTSGGNLSLSAGEVRRGEVTVVAPAGAATMGPRIAMGGSSQTFPAGATLEMRYVLIERLPGPALPFFYGGTVDNTGIAYSFEGVANASPSVAKAAVVEVFRNYHTDPGARTSTGRWGFWAGSGGTGSYAIAARTWSRSGTVARAEWSAGNGTETIGTQLNGLGLPASGVVTVEYDIVVSASGGTLRPRVGGSSGEGWSTVDRSPDTPAVANTVIHQWGTFNIGTGTTPRAFSEWQGGRPADGWSEISNVVVYPGPRNPLLAYFDGDTTPDADLTGSSHLSV